MKEAGHKGPHIIWFHLYETSSIGKSMDRKYISGARGWARELEGGAHGAGASFWGDGNVLELDSGQGR